MNAKSNRAETPWFTIGTVSGYCPRTIGAQAALPYRKIGNPTARLLIQAGGSDVQAAARAPTDQNALIGLGALVMAIVLISSALVAIFVSLVSTPWLAPVAGVVTGVSVLNWYRSSLRACTLADRTSPRVAALVVSLTLGGVWAVLTTSIGKILSSDRSTFITLIRQEPDSLRPSYLLLATGVLMTVVPIWQCFFKQNLTTYRLVCRINAGDMERKEQPSD